MRGLVVVSWALLALTVSGCLEEENRALKRKIRMDQMRVPAIALPSNQGNFDFQTVVNQQAYDIVRRMPAFSLHKTDPQKIYDPTGLNVWEIHQFHTCTESIEPARTTVTGGSVSETASCLIDQNQGLVSGDLHGFQLTASDGRTLSMLDVAVQPESSFDFRKYEVTLSMQIKDPFVPSGTITTMTQASYRRDIGVDAMVDFRTLTAGSKIYFQSALRKIVDEALAGAFRDLKYEWDKVSSWYATVIRACDKQLFLSGGTKNDVGLRVGDVVRVHSVLYLWSGPVCQSNLQSASASERPIGYAKIMNVGENISIAQLIENDPDYPLSVGRIIRPGSRIYLEKWAPTP